ncbi:glycosyl hydrolases family 2, TIM barrel domain-containing protein [Dunaliella salina]|uniref:beta-galactosidase n=1 Tax=Dunaliella salina TaxID=3046 RepID=A0ABQ7GB11_DUNSA|nr:glycosyl hydrolases family 2, TIM barrel domain-containing protein [Dunaliella salina]|eukprot:KAF5831794.1 glycosyl hydrolases family 2, TIM barrel domain-containing protein [Dunaliella salina]
MFMPGSVYSPLQVGFRHTAVKDGKLLHNGRPLMIRGVCRHEWDPRTGKALSEESMLRDIKLLKQSNFNAVRCSHYPNHNRWYELCNIMGLHLVDEANMETHGFDAVFRDNHMHPANSSQWLPVMLDRCSRMYERDKNHPCVTLWSLGNECGYGPAHDAMAAMLRAKDPSRPVQYEGGGSRTSATDVVCPMYPRTKQIAALLTTGKDHRPIVLCEYAHSMGNSTGNFRDYWQQFESTPGCAGGFIWDWADQCLEAVWQEDLPGALMKRENNFQWLSF